jgi:hypothetical protein
MRSGRVLLAILALLFVGEVSAFQLDAEAPPEERRLLGVSYSRLAWLERQIAQFGAPLLFSDPIHEGLTTRMFGCEGNDDLCEGAQSIAADPAVLVGVRWNDDPPFRLRPEELKGTACKPQTIRFQTQPRCWLQLFISAEKGAANGKVYGPGDGLLYRTHFGDMQFLHAMDKTGSNAQATRAKIMAWAEFSWRVSVREWPRNMKMRDVPIAGFSEIFGNTEWDVRDLFIQGSPLLERRVDQVAFGSLLHMIQDSFALGHADRIQPTPNERCTLMNDSVPAPGRVREFHSYSLQDHDAHALEDSREAKDRHLQNNPNVVALGRPLVDAFDQRRPWSDVQPYMACLFALSDTPSLSGPGDRF